MGALLILLGACPALAVDDGAGRREIVIGGPVTLSGPLGPTGEELTKHGVDVAVGIVNDGNGVHGRRLRTVWRDDGGEATRAAAEAARLIADERVFALLTPLGADVVAAVVAEAGVRNVPVLFPADGAPALRGLGHVIAGTMLYDRQSRLTIDYLIGTRKAARFALLYQDDGWGRMMRDLVEHDLGRHRVRPVAAVPIDAVPTDVGGPVARLMAARPDVTLFMVTPRAAAEVLKERSKRAWKAAVVAMGPLADERYLGIAGPTAEGVEALVLWPDPVRSEVPGVVRYREALQRRFPKSEPTRASLAGYFAGTLFAEAARRAGRHLTREALIGALERMQGWESGILPPLTIGRDHETQRRGQWARMSRGRLTPVTDWLDGD